MLTCCSDPVDVNLFTGPFVAVGATDDPYMVSAPWVNLSAAQGKQGVNCSGVTKDPCSCSWYAGGVETGSPVFEFAGAPGCCYALGMNCRTVESCGAVGYTPQPGIC